MISHSFNPRSATGARRFRLGGFTLLEILVVLSIIGLLVSLAAVSVDDLWQRARIDTAKIFVSQSLKTSLHLYARDMGEYPTTAEGLQALLVAPAGAEGRWRGPYLEKARSLKDPWNRDYQYRYPGTKNKTGYDVFSFGPDPLENENDIGNW